MSVKRSDSITAAALFVFARTLANQNLPPGVATETISRFTHMIMAVSLIFGAIVALVLLYLVVTRRKAFREACAAEQ